MKCECHNTHYERKALWEYFLKIERQIVIYNCCSGLIPSFQFSPQTNSFSSDLSQPSVTTAVSPDIPSVGDTVLKKGVKLELNESTDTASEADVIDRLTEYVDSEDDVPSGQDDAKNDPDWDPESDGDLGNAPGDPESSCSDVDGGSVGEELSDHSIKKWKCQACAFCCHAQYILRIHVSKTHYKAASRSGQCMCRLCGKMEDSLESLQEHRQVSR